MKALEFEAVLNPDDSLGVPKEVAEQLPRQRKLQVIVLYPDPSEIGEAKDTGWRRLTREQFLRGYSEGDAIYDSL